jgi:hypothetical protein
MVQFLSTNKKGQAWSFDVLIATIIFIVGIVLVFYNSINYIPQTENELSELYNEANFATELLLREDSPGILNEGKINDTKLEEFYNLSYQEQKNILGVINNFYFELEGMNFGGTEIDYIGEINLDEENLIKIERVVVYNNRILDLDFYSWN